MVRSLPVLERAALHQTRFRTPGVAPDARGVVLGQLGLLLFPSLDRLVAFLRAYGEAGSLDELLGSLKIRRVTTPLKTRELILTFHAESSYRMDQVAQVAKLTGALTFTGTTRHFVKYRDAGSPLGYDTPRLEDAPADFVLYHDAFSQPYALERELPFGDLLHRLTAVRDVTANEEAPKRVLVTCESGIGGALTSYLFRWRAKARAAILEWPSGSAFDDNVRRRHLFVIDDPEPRIVRLFASLPGVLVFLPVLDRVGVQLGHRHPVPLESCASVFAEGSLTLFRGDGTVDVVEKTPPLVDVRALVRTTLDGAQLDQAADPRRRALAEVDPSVLSLALRVSPSNDPARHVVASVVPLEQREWLAKVLYFLPPTTLASLRVALTTHSLVLFDSRGIEGVPIGRYYSAVTERVYVPVGTALVPAVAPEVLRDLLGDVEEHHVFFEDGSGAPWVVPSPAFAPVTRALIRSIEAGVVEVEPLAEDEASLPLLEYAEARRFPLFGVPTPSPDKTEEP